MDEFAQDLGYLVLSATLIGGLIWLTAKSPLLYWLLKVGFLAGWGIVTVGGVLFVVFTIYLPDGRYGRAILALLVGAVMYVPWFAFGWPALRQSFPPKQDETLLWS